MKRILGLITLIGIGVSASASPTSLAGKSAIQNQLSDKDKTQGIHFFEGTWQEALAMAKKKDKLIFLDAYASWCGPCKMMAKTTFKDEEVGTFFNENFINFKMDMEKHPEGARLSNDLYLTAYPTLYFLSHSEKPIYKTLGYLKPKKLLSEAEVAMGAKSNKPDRKKDKKNKKRQD